MYPQVFALGGRSKTIKILTLFECMEIFAENLHCNLSDAGITLCLLKVKPSKKKVTLKVEIFKFHLEESFLCNFSAAGETFGFKKGQSA